MDVIDVVLERGDLVLVLLPILTQALFILLAHEVVSLLRFTLIIDESLLDTTLLDFVVLFQLRQALFGLSVNFRDFRFARVFYLSNLCIHFCDAGSELLLDFFLCLFVVSLVLG